MKKIMRLFIAVFLLCAFNLSAQVDLKNYKIVYFQEVVFETDDYKLFLVRCFAREEVLKIKVRVFNKTNDLIFIKPEEFSFVIHGATLKGSGRAFVVQANGDESRIIDVSDKGMNMKCESFEITLNGFYKIANDGDVYAAPNSEWPSNRGTTVSAGPISCNLIDNKMGKEKSFAKYSCIYSGDKMAILDPSKAVAIMPKGQENPCTIKKDAYIIEKGESDIITLEFKRYNGAGDLTDGIQVKWKETFRTAAPVALKTIKVPMKIDLEKSEK